MVRAIVEFLIFAAICGVAGYLFWKHSALKQDLKDDGTIK